MLRAQYKRSNILGFLRFISFVDKNPRAGVCVSHICYVQLCMENYSTYTNYEKVSIYTKFKS